MLRANPSAQHPLNRHLFIADNLSLLRRLDNASIDLVCIDPPFAKNQMSQEKRESELETLRIWGINSAFGDRQFP